LTADISLLNKAISLLDKIGRLIRHRVPKLPLTQLQSRTPNRRDEIVRLVASGQQARHLVATLPQFWEETEHPFASSAVTFPTMIKLLSFSSTLAGSGSFIKPTQFSVTALAFSFRSLAQRSISGTVIEAPEWLRGHATISNCYSRLRPNRCCQ
jgi:hypothetical protein